MNKQFLTGAVAVGTLAIGSLLQANPANALTLNSSNVGQTFTVNFNGNVNTTNVDGLSSKADFTLRSFTGTKAIFDVLLTNTSSSPITASRVSALGFDVDPNISNGSIVPTTIGMPPADAINIFANANFTGNTQFPNGFGSIDICFINNQNNCTGGSSGGVTFGQSGAFAFALDFLPSTTSFTLANFGVRYQSIDGNTYRDASGTGKGVVVPPSDPNPIPTPAMIPGLIGMSVAALRKKKQGVEAAQNA